jgi:hypothetical protein
MPQHLRVMGIDLAPRVGHVAGREETGQVVRRTYTSSHPLVRGMCQGEMPGSYKSPGGCTAKIFSKATAKRVESPWQCV